MRYPLDLREQDEPMYARGWKDAIAETAAFLERLAERIDVLNMRTRIEAAADCRAMAAKLREGK